MTHMFGNYVNLWTYLVINENLDYFTKNGFNVITKRGEIE